MPAVSALGEVGAGGPEARGYSQLVNLSFVWATQGPVSKREEWGAGQMA